MHILTVQPQAETEVRMLVYGKACFLLVYILLCLVSSMPNLICYNINLLIGFCQWGRYEFSAVTCKAIYLAHVYKYKCC